MLLAVGCSAGAVLIFRAWGGFRPGSAERRTITGLDILPTLLLVALVVAISVPGSSAWGVLGSVAIVIATESLAWVVAKKGSVLESISPRFLANEVLPSRVPVARPSRNGYTGRHPRLAPDLRAAPNRRRGGQAPGERLFQRMTRTRGPDGVETARGELVVEFEKGQRVAMAHVAFCPPFFQAPTSLLQQGKGPSARLRTGQVLAYGARIEIKLEQPADGATAISVDFEFRAGPDVAPPSFGGAAAMKQPEAPS